MEEPAEISGEKVVEVAINQQYMAVAINQQYMGILEKHPVQVQSQPQSQSRPSQKIEEVQNVISMPESKPVVKKRRFTPEELRAIEVAAENTVEQKAEIKVELPAEMGIDEFIGSGPIEKYSDVQAKDSKNESNSGLSDIVSTTLSISSIWSSNFAPGGTTVSVPPTLSDDERLMFENEVARSHAEENERIRLETEYLNAARLRAEENARSKILESERLCIEAEREAERSRAEENLRQSIETEQLDAARLRAEENARLQILENERLCIEAEREAARSRAEEIKRQRVEQQGRNERLRLETEQEAARSQAREVERQRFEAERRIARLAAERELRRLETDQLAAKSKAEEDRQRLLGEYEEIAKSEAKEKEVKRVVESTQMSRTFLQKSNPVEIPPVWPVPSADVIPEPGEQNKSLEVAAEIVVEKKVEINVERAAEIAIENDPFYFATRKWNKPDTKVPEDKVEITSQTVENSKVASQSEIKRDPKIQQARKQPKSEEEEAMLQAKYSSMEPGERAFAILLDLGMIEEHLDPDSPSYDSAFDNDLVPGMIIK